MNKKHITIIVCSLVVIFSLSIFLHNSIAKEKKSDVAAEKNSSSVEKPKAEKKKDDLAKEIEKKEEEAEEIISVSAMLAPMSLEDLEKTSALVVCGTIKGVSDAFKDEEDRISTEYYVTPNKVFRGEAPAGNEPITVRIGGGLVDGTLLEILDGPELVEGNDYLLFLKEPIGEGRENAGYYLLNGDTQGIYVFPDGENAVNSKVKNVKVDSQHTGEKVELKSIENDLIDINAECPAEQSKEAEIEEIKKNLKHNYDEGLLPKEDYERYVDELE